MGDAPSQTGQEQRYAEAVAAFGPGLVRLARGYERDPEASRDLLQEIHVALWRSLARFDGRCSLRTWVYRVAHNTATSKVLRPLTHAPTLVAIGDDLESLASAVDHRADHDAALDRGRALERLHLLIQRLRPIDRQVMLLYLEEMDAASIAEVTGLSAVNVATKVGRIKRILARQFHEGVPDGK
jgi:RNA polymerase sigma-70 factor (ECF subfamily)